MSENLWKATITYRTDDGLKTSAHDLAEMEDLHDIIEQGPHFDTVVHVSTVRAGYPQFPGLTIEESLKL